MSPFGRDVNITSGIKSPTVTKAKAPVTTAAPQEVQGGRDVTQASRPSAEAQPATPVTTAGVSVDAKAPPSATKTDKTSSLAKKATLTKSVAPPARAPLATAAAAVPAAKPTAVATKAAVVATSSVVRAKPKGGKAPAKDDNTALHGDISGGDISDCLAASDLDGLLQPLLGKHYVKATTLYQVRIGQKPAEAVRERLANRVSKVGWLLAPLHVRFHWTTAIFHLKDEVLTMHVLDSAPSPITRGDINDLANRLGIPLAHVVAPVTQQARSNECGLHVVQYALLAATRSVGVLTDYVSRERGKEISLAAWRGTLPAMLPSGISHDGITSLLATVPDYAFKIADEKPTEKPFATTTRPAASSTIRRNDPYAADVFTKSPPAYHEKHQFDVAAGAEVVPLGLPNGPGENVCSFNSLCQALGCRERAPQLIGVSRAKGLNKAVGPSRVQEDVSEIAARSPTAAGLRSDIALKYVRSWSACGHTSVRFEKTSFVPTTSGVACQYMSEDEMNCSVCRARSKASTVVSIESAPTRLVFTLNRARHDVTRSSEVARVPFMCPKFLVVAGTTFAVTGLVHHLGTSTKGGHYIGYRKIGAHWYCFNDENVTLNEPHPSATQQCGVVAVYDPVPGGVLRLSRVPSGPTTAAPVPIVPPAEAPVEPLPGRPRGARAKTVAPAPPDKRPVDGAMTHGAIRRLLSTTKPGDILRVHYHYNGEAGIWEGPLKPCVPGSSASFVSYTQHLCVDCGHWHALEFPHELEFPYPNALYFSATVHAALGSVHPDCDPDRFELDASQDAAVSAPICPQSAVADDRDREALGEEERQTLGIRAPATNVDLKGSVGLRWNVFPGKPDHVHTITWRKLAASTRVAHITWLYRIKGMPIDLHRLPLATAIVELVLRFAKDRSWAWSTIASNLSCAASALKSLHMYTDQPRGYNLRLDEYFADTMKHAQTLARKYISETQLTPPMSPEICERLCRSVRGVPSTWLLAKLCWCFAARVGDMRQVRKADVHFKPVTADGAPISITFRHGKGAAFWGPYTIHSVVPEAVAQPFLAHLHAAGKEAVFSGNDQSRLSLAVRGLKDDVPGINLRSFRRGSLMYLASVGVSDSDLMMLSGHKRPDTLLRYLNWGEFSTTAATSAANRAQLLAAATERMEEDDDDLYESDEEDADVATLIAGAGELLTEDMKFVMPPKMGLRSGYIGHRGQRIKRPPQIFPLGPPPARELGIEEEQDDPSTYPLHVKRVGLIDLKKVAGMASDGALKGAQLNALHWLQSDENYGIDWAPLAPTQVPLSKLTPDEVATLLDFGKLRRHSGPIRSFAKCWLLPQPSKRVRRPIMEPFINDTMLLEALPKLRMPSRLERRAQTVGAQFQAEFDFAAYYDQLALPETLGSCYVIRTKSADGRDELWQLTRLPMGVRFAVAVAQYVTWTVTEPIAEFCSTCIDNVRITARTPEDFIKAVRTFLKRCDAVGATLNERDTWNISDDEILNRGHTNWIGPVNFVGEQYRKQTVANTEKCMRNLPAAFALVQDSRETTRRRFAALIGLIIYMTHTVSIGLHRFFSLLRAYARLVSPSAPVLLDVKWDEPVKLVHSVIADMTHAVGLLLPNKPVPVHPLLQPAKYSSAYDVVIIVDAAASGWGAYVLTKGDILKLQRGWNSTIAHSAHAEPKAASEALLWAKGNIGSKAHIAVVSDHSALADGQRRWWSGYGGFSASFPLNTFYNEFYSSVDLNVVRRDVFFVEGSKNPADGPSRSVSIGDPLSVSRATDFVFPDVSTFFHPYAERPPRAHYEV
jgi:hypothetical protein